MHFFQKNTTSILYPRLILYTLHKFELNLLFKTVKNDILLNIV